MSSEFQQPYNEKRYFMENFTLVDGVMVSIVSIVVVFLVLIILMFILQLFSSFLKEDTNPKEIQKQNTAAHSDHTLSSGTSIDTEDTEAELVAALMALVLANEDQQDKKYQITTIKRIR